MHLVFIKYSSSIQQVFIKYSSSIHQVFIKYSSSIHQVFIKYSSSIHQLFIKYSSSIHQLFIEYSSSIHHRLGAAGGVPGGQKRLLWRPFCPPRWTTKSGEIAVRVVKNGGSHNSSPAARGSPWQPAAARGSPRKRRKSRSSEPPIHTRGPR